MRRFKSSICRRIILLTVVILLLGVIVVNLSGCLLMMHSVASSLYERYDQESANMPQATYPKTTPKDTIPNDLRVLEPVVLTIPDGFYYLDYDINLIYDTLLKNFKANNSNFDIAPELGIVGEIYTEQLIDEVLAALDLAFYYVLDYNPEIFFIDTYEINYYYSADNTMMTVFFNYKYVAGYNVNTAAVAMDELNKKVTSLVDSINNMNLTVYEKELYVHDYLIKNIAYSVELIDDDPNNDDARVHYAASAILKGSAVCDGYARAFQLLMNRLGVETYMVYGDSDSYLYEPYEDFYPNHAWNIIFIDGDFYHVDLTLNDITTDQGLAEYVDYTYFNVTDSLISKDHADWYTIFDPTPVCDATKWAYK